MGAYFLLGIDELSTPRNPILAKFFRMVQLAENAE
jgi:predicted HTH transcriptional regulator